MRWWLVVLLCGLPYWAQALTFTEDQGRFNLGPHLQVFEDVRGIATIEQVSSQVFDSSFRNHNQSILNAGYTDSVFWLRIDLHYQPLQRKGTHQRLLQLNYPPMDNVQLYLPSPTGYFLAAESGDTLPFHERPIRVESHMFALSFEPGQMQRVYLRVSSQGSMQMPLLLWLPETFIEEQPARIYLLGIIYGVLLVMLIYNLFIYVSVRDTSYLYYILYIAAFGLYQVSVNGAGVFYLWPNSPYWANAATPALVGATAIFGCLFTRSFLRTAQYSPWMNRLLLSIAVCGALVVFLGLARDYSTAIRMASYLSLVFTVSVFYAGILAWLKGMRVARYFIIAWSAFLAGALSNTLMVLGYLPNNFFTMYASQIGSAVEVALLSLALADRINQLKEQRAALQYESSVKLAALNRDLARSNRFKDQFLSTVTHELRTPMNGVIGSLELMQTLKLDAEQAHYQQTAAASARDMMSMVNDILLLTELQADKIYPRIEPFSLRGLLDGISANFEARAVAKGLAFKVQLDEALPDTLDGDPQKLSKILGYLLDNAFKFTRQGQVTLKVSGELEADHLQLKLQVQDTGIGFEAHQAERLYHNFEQLDNTITRQYGGLGIGLPICRQLIELLGGTLEHQSTLNEGSCFTATISLSLTPQARKAAPVVRRAQAPLRRTAQQCTVLVVEDDTINQLVIRGMLLKLGYQVRVADNGQEALRLLEQQRVDAVLLDCQMPVMDGFATCRALRQLAGCADLPVLAVTAHSHSGDRDRCLAAGMNDYITKPVKFLELQALLHDWVLCREANTPAPSLAQ